MTILPAITLTLIPVAGLILLAATLLGRSRERGIERRVRSLENSVRSERGSAAGAPIVAWRAALGRRMRLIFTVGMARSWGTDARIPFLTATGAIAAVGAWVLAYHTLRFPPYIALLLAAVGFLVPPRIVLRREQRRADARFADQLPDAIDMVVRMVRAGLPVGVAVRTVGRESDLPLSLVFIKIADLAEIGNPLPEALKNAAEEVGSDDFRFFSVAVALQQATGGNLAVTLDTLSEIIRKRRAVRLKARAATAEIRMSAIVLGAIPFLIVGALLLTSPQYLRPLISDPRGNVIAGVAISCLALAGLTMRSMIQRSLRA